MQYFVWGTDRPDGLEKRKAFVREHWDFIARYDDRLIARGPVLDDSDPLIMRGSIHIVDLDDAEEARHFAYDEPFAREGLFSEIVVRRFALELDRTQFDFVMTPDLERYMVYRPATAGATEPPDVADAWYREWDAQTVCRGALLHDEVSGNDGGWAGRLFFLEVPDRATLDRFVDGDPCAQAGLYAETRIHRWTLGGAENLRAVGLVS